MDTKMIALIVVVVIIVVGGAYYIGTMLNPATNTTISNNTTGNASNFTTHETTKHKNATNKNDTSDIKISSKEAQEIAVGTAQELGGHNDTAGTPTLFKWTQNSKHTWVWDVPLFDASTKKSDGSLDIDAMTGEVIMNE